MALYDALLKVGKWGLSWAKPGVQKEAECFRLGELNQKNCSKFFRYCYVYT